MKLLCKPDSIKEIFNYLMREFPEEARPYLFIDTHPDQRHEMLSIRSLIFPRSLLADKTKLIFAPIVFVPKHEDLSSMQK